MVSENGESVGGDSPFSGRWFSRSGNWLIPNDEIVDGGAGADGIPSIDDPQFQPVGSPATEYIADRRLVIGIKIGETVRAYPHQVIAWHEIVNDQIGNTNFALTYCPLTGTASGWDRTVNGEVTEFGVSGLLFRNNLIPYDRNSNSLYSQMQLRGVRGDHSGRQVTAYPLIQTTWETWKKMYPNSQVLTTNTGFDRDYHGYAYGQEYLEERSEALFPIKHRDNSFFNKERVHGIIGGPIDESGEPPPVRVFVIEQFGAGVNLVHDQVGDLPVIVAGSTIDQYAVSFMRRTETSDILEFTAVQDSLPVIMKDQEGNRWDLFGYAVEGPRKGERLIPVRSYSGYWFAWHDFYPHLEVYQQ
ncbi:DUF3179 domain-containing protein [Aliifodinibius sp. S!AR15-10]|nr:DUF3179 domain-containing protein [Aliifodinibius sp. S!AR15-10]